MAGGEITDGVGVGVSSRCMLADEFELGGVGVATGGVHTEAAGGAMLVG